jgi:hypothetical protein
MLERISWSSYWMVVVIVSAIYYLVLVVLLFQKGFFSKISSHSGEEKSFSGQQPNLFGFEGNKENSRNQINQQQPSDDQPLMPVVHDLIQELKGFIADISERSYVKEELVMGIQVITKNYKQLEASPYQKFINDFIKSACEDYCSIHLSEEDVRRIWIG